MKLIGFQISNFRRIKAIEMKMTDQGLVQIRGRNEQGKSSILDACELLLRGPKSMNMTDITRHGAGGPVRIEGTFQAHDGMYRVERVIDGDKYKLKITHDGKTISQAPQGFLDTLINELTFDPRPFLNKNDRDKFDFMKRLLKLDTTAIDKQVDPDTGTLYMERYHLGRKRDAIGIEELPPEPLVIDIMSLNQKKNDMIQRYNAEIAALAAYNEQQRNRKRAIEERDAKLAKQEVRVKSLKDQIADLQAQLKEETKQLTELKTVILPEPEPQKAIEPLDTSSVDTAMAEAVATSNAHQAWEKIKARIDQRNELDTQYKFLTQKIETLRAERRAMIANAHIPVKDVTLVVDDGFTPDGVYHKGIHSSGWSESQAMRISAELCVAMQPELRCLFIDKGEAYDGIALKALHDWAIENDIQAMITIVDSDIGSEDGAIYIEDGSIV